MNFPASFSVYILGTAMLVALTMCSRRFGSLGEPSFLIWLAVAGVAYILAIRDFFTAATFPRRVIVIGLVLAAVWHLLFLMKPPGPDDDIHRYVWDGRVQRLGYNPYILIPADPALRGLHTDETRTLNNPWLPTIYPPGAELFFRAVTAIHESVLAMKTAFVACDVAIVVILLGWLHYRGEALHWVLAYAWNPLLATEVAGSGHVDIVGALLLLISFVALERRWRTLAALAFGLAVSVKFLPIVLLPLYWKRVRLRDGALAAALVALFYLPFLNYTRMPVGAIDAYRGRMPIGSLGSYVGYFRFNDPVFATLERFLAPRNSGWVGRARRFVRRGLLQKQAIDQRCRRICVADGSDASVCPRCLSLVLAVATAVSEIHLDFAHPRVDRRHYSDLLCVAFTHRWAPVAGSGLGDASGVWMCRNCCCVCLVPAVEASRSHSHWHRLVHSDTFAGRKYCIHQLRPIIQNPRHKEELHERFEPYNQDVSSGFLGFAYCCNLVGPNAAAHCRRDGENLRH